MITFLAPRTASKVLRISSSRACTRTCTVTSSGICPPSIRVRRISYSVSEAEGKPTSISLKPQSTKVWKSEFFRNTHRCYQCLVAVAQINTAPYRCFSNRFIRPLTVGNFYLFKRNIFFSCCMINFPLAFLSDYKQKSPSLTCVFITQLGAGNNSTLYHPISTALQQCCPLSLQQGLCL